MSEGGASETARPAKRYYCYMVRCADGSFYTGWTGDPVRRVRQHNSGAGGAYTRTHRPVELVYLEEVASKADALRREIEIKRYPHAKKEKMAWTAPVEARPPEPKENPDDRNAAEFER